MKADQLIALFVRLLAISIVLFGLRQIASTATYYLEAESAVAVWITALTVFVLFLIAVMLWRYPLTVARKLYVSDPEPTKTTDWTIESLYEIGFVLLGVYIVYTAVTSLMFWWLYAILASESFENRAIFNVDNKASIILSVIELAIGLWLVLGAKGLRQVLFNLRNWKVD